jgi:hypothetical protein
MKFILTFILLKSYLIYSMESTEQEGPLARDASGFAISLQDLNSPCEITQHWLDAVEQSRFEAESRFTRSEESEHLRKSYEYLDFQKTEILKFLEKIESNSMEQLLDDLLNYRIHYIKLRKGVIDRAAAQNQPDHYVELAPRSPQRTSVYQQEFDDYNELTYNRNMIRSVCLNMLIKAVFRQIEDPKKLKAQTKHKIRVQPSLFSYLVGEGEIPWALDVTIADQFSRNLYHEIPDFALISDYFGESQPVTIDLFGLGAPKKTMTVMKTRYDAGLKVKYNLPYPDFLRLSIPAANEIAEPVIVTEMQPLARAEPQFALPVANEIAEPVIVTEMQPLARAEPQFALPVADKTAEQVMTKETLTIAIDETQEDPQAASKRLEQPLLEQSAINQIVRKKQAAQDALPKVKTSIFSRVHDWLQNKLFNHQIKTINGKEWAGTIEKIDGVAIRRDSGSSHFEVLLEGKVVGGFFHSNEYSVGYKKRLQQIIINLGYSPSPHRSPQKTVPNSRAASS